MADTIYLDNQAATPIDPAVLEALIDAMRREFANPSSEDHHLGWSARETVERARSSIATNIGAEAEEVIFTSGATEADNIGVLGAALGAPMSRRRILVGATEHKAVIEAALAASRHGFTIEFVPVDQNGLIDFDQLEAMLGSDVAVVSIMAVNNEIGTIQDIEKVCRVVSAVGAFVHCDATQAPAALDVDVATWGVDAASFSSHKIYGPKGIGALFLSRIAPWRPAPLIFGGGQESGFRPGTIPAPLCVGFAKALSVLASRRSERVAIAALRDRLAEGLKRIAPTLVETSAIAARHPGNLHVRFPGIDASDLLGRLQPELAASSGSACTSGQIAPSHVLQAVGLTAKEAAEGVRFSIGRFNTSADIDAAISLVGRALESIERAAQPAEKD